jgi:hypothetical protein
MIFSKKDQTTNWDACIFAFAKIIDGIFILISLGHYRSDWEFKLVCKAMMYKIPKDDKHA